MENECDRELRDGILLLVRACKLWQSRAVASSIALSRIVDLPRREREMLSAQALRSFADQARLQGSVVAEQQAASLEQALSGSSEFLDALRLYAFKHFLRSAFQ
jgi:hypothetical protein